MIFLWNSEIVWREILEMAALRIADRLKLSPNDVHVTVEIADANIVPSFAVDTGLVDEEIAVEAITEIWGKARGELFRRLRGLKERRKRFWLADA